MVTNVDHCHRYDGYQKWAWRLKKMLGESRNSLHRHLLAGALSIIRNSQPEG